MGFVVVGTAYSAWYMGSTAHIGDIAPTGRHGQRMGLFYACFALGNVIGPILAGFVAGRFGYVAMFLTMAGVSGLGFVLSFSTREKVRGPEHTHL